MSNWEQISSKDGINGLYMKDGWSIYVVPENNKAGEPRFTVSNNGRSRAFISTHAADRVSIGEDFPFIDAETTNFEMNAGEAVLGLVKSFPVLK